MMVSSLRPEYLAVLDTNIMMQYISEKDTIVNREFDIHIYCGIKINVISMMNDLSVDLSPITFFLTASR